MTTPEPKKKEFVPFNQMTPAQKAEFFKRNPDIHDTAKLRAILDKERSRPNKVTLKDFEQFIPLFQNPPEFETEREGAQFDVFIRQLTQLYTKTFDMYKETHIYQNAGDKEPILILPPVFVRMSAISNTPENQMAVRNFRNRGFSDIPAYVAQAESVLYEAMRRTINAPENRARYNEVRSITRQHFDTFMEKRFPGSIKGRPAAKRDALPKNGNPSSYTDNTEDEFI